MSLPSTNLETIFLMVAGLLLGAVPAFIFIGFYFGNRFAKDRKAMKLAYDRQVTALRDTVRRLMDRIELLTGEQDKLKRTNKALREAVRDQHQITDRSSHELEDAQQNLVRMQERVDDLQAENLRYEGRMEQVAINQERMSAQFRQTVDQFMQTKRMRQNLIFAATKLRESQVSNEALESRLSMELKSLDEDDPMSADQLDVGVLEGMEPVYVERLHESGIYTVADLAQQTPARVAHFAGLPTWDDSAAWIAEAKLILAKSDSN